MNPVSAPALYPQRLFRIESSAAVFSPEIAFKINSDSALTECHSCLAILFFTLSEAGNKNPPSSVPDGGFKRECF